MNLELSVSCSGNCPGLGIRDMVLISALSFRGHVPMGMMFNHAEHCFLCWSAGPALTKYYRLTGQLKQGKLISEAGSPR